MTTGDRPLALVTGAGGGIGTGVSRMLSERGHDVIAVERSSELAERAAVAIGPGTIAVSSDASRLEVLVCSRRPPRHPRMDTGDKS